MSLLHRQHHARTFPWFKIPGSQFLYELIWGLGCLLLPLTSLPALIDLSGASTVAPISVLFFLLLGLLWLVPVLLKGGILPFEVKPFFVFLGIVVFSWAVSFFRYLPAYRGYSILSEAREAFITLVMGAATFIVAAGWFSSDHSRARRALKWLNAGGVLQLSWASLQAVYVFFDNSDYPRWMYAVQQVVSSRRESLFPDRITGLAYEPSWLAHQLIMIYLPFWLAATLTGFTLYRRRRFLPTFENILLVWGVLVLFETFSRVGWLSLFLILAFVLIDANLRLVQKIQQRLFARRQVRSAMLPLSKAAVTTGILFFFGIVYLAGAVGLIYLGGRLEPRFQKFFSPELYRSTGIMEAANTLFFAERAIYWLTGWEVFGAHPVLGVGLGNAGFYFVEQMPAYGWHLTEIQNMYYRFIFMPNTKSLWIRTLAETGVLGFSVFAAWLVLVFRSADLCKRSAQPLHRTLGLFGQLVLVGFLTEGFSIDSFALPYFWLSIGIITGNSLLLRKTISVQVNQQCEDGL